MTRTELEAQIAQLAARLGRLERHLHLPPPETQVPAGKDLAEATIDPKPVEIRAEDHVDDEPAGVTEPAADSAITPRAPLPERLLDRRSSRTEKPPVSPPKSAARLPTAPPVHPIRQVKTAKRPRSNTSLELLIGGKWAAWLGTIAVLFATGFFIKYAYDRGLFSLLSDTGKCLIAAGFGLSLIVAGEVVLRRVGRLAATGFYSSGVGTLYLTAFAACKYFELISETSAFFLLALVALLGFAITIRGRLLVIGVLSVVCGYLTPILLSGASSHIAALPMYLTMVLSVALALSAAYPQPFRPLRYVALAGAGVMGALWAMASGSGHWEMILISLCLWWALATGEALWAALRNQSPIGNGVVSLIATAWMVVIGCLVINAAQGLGFNWLGLYTAGIGLVAAAIAFQFGPGLDGLRGRSERALDKLAIALWVQAGALLATAVALQFPGYGIPVGWLLLGLAAIEIGRRLPSRGVDIFGLIVLVVAILRVFLFDSWTSTALNQTFLLGPNLTLTHWYVVALLTVLAMHAAAHRLRSRGRGRWVHVPAVLAIAGTFGWAALWLIHGTGTATTVGWIGGAVVLFSLRSLDARLHYAVLSQALLLAAAFKWVVVDTLAIRLSEGWEPVAGLPFVSPEVITGLLLVGSSCAFVLLLRRATASDSGLASTDACRRGDVSLPDVTSVLMPLCLTWAATFEIDRLVALNHQGGADLTWSQSSELMLWLTIAWSLLGIGYLMTARLARFDTWRYVGSLQMMLAVGLWLFPATLGSRVMDGVADARIFLNLQVIAGATACTAMLVLARAAGKSTWRIGAEEIEGPRLTGLCLVLVGVIGLWIGSLEIDRYAAFHLADASQARQTGWSVFWAVYGIGLIVLGFCRRRPQVRYAGLGLLAVTLVKVFVVDTAEVASVYRVASLLGVGLLLLLTSVAYFKWLPRLNSASDSTETAELGEVSARGS